jgi:DNA-binding response OmpR family regulator/LmbE family N-acetylglucosaminyl deacetylase
VRLLLIDSDVRLAAALSGALRRTGYRVQHVQTAAAAPVDPRWDLVLVDPGPARGEGLDLCRRLRSLGDMGIVVLAASGSERDRVAALRSGADDYIAKPFSFAELHARLEAVLRRVRPPEQGVLRAGQLSVDLGRHQASIDSTPVELTPKEFQVLAMLARQPGAVVCRERLIAEVWPAAKPGGTRSLDVHVATLRSKIRSAARVEAIRGVGYRLEPGTGETDAPVTWQVVVVSPHFDDAVLSAAGWIIRSAGQAAVVTVLGGVPPEDVAPSDWDRLCGFRSAAEAARVRAGEDVEACQVLGADSVHLSHLDGPYAKDDDLTGLTDFIRAIPPDSRILVPAGVGGNPDHVRVRDAALRTLAARPDQVIGLYADLPYAASLWHWGTEDMAGALAGRDGLRVLTGLSGAAVPGGAGAEVVVEHLRLDPEEWGGKRQAVGAHASQLATLGSHAYRLTANPGPLQHELVWWIGGIDAAA